MKFRLSMTAAILLAATGELALAAVEADPNKDYQVTPEAGPWMICADSFSGDGADKMAHKLVIEIRSRYHLAAYVFNHGAELRQQQLEDMRRRRIQIDEQLRRAGIDPNTVVDKHRSPHFRIEEQFAVLIGGYADVDAAHHELAQIKKLQPPKSVPQDMLIVPLGDKTADGKTKAEGIPINPFLKSFVVANPTVKRAKEEKAIGPDPFLKELNSGESYSLLQCRQPWTLVIKEYTAPAVVQPQSAPPSAFEKLFGKSPGDVLNAAGMNAHMLAEALRKSGLEAYVLHTRTSSIVTIGGFDSADDPRMKQVVRTLGRWQMGPQMDLLPRPMPMPVPRLR